MNRQGNRLVFLFAFLGFLLFPQLLPAQSEKGYYEDFKKAQLEPDSVLTLDVAFAGSRMPQELVQMRRMRDLRIEFPDSSAFDWPGLMKLLVKLPELESLSIRGGSMKTLPKGISKLHLKTLLIRSSGLEKLDPEICLMKSLESLWLPNNSIRSLPDSIGKLVNLKQLDLSQNKLTALPESFGKLVNLKLAVFNLNAITALPKSVCNLVKAERLIFSRNPVSETEKERVKACFPKGVLFF